MRMPWLDEKTPQDGLDSYKVGVAVVATHVTLWNAKTFSASFYLRLSGGAAGRETLGERLNDSATRFLPCKIDDRVELANLSTISHLRVFGSLPEAEVAEQLGAIRQPARVTMRSGYTLVGDFLYIQPSARARLSDMLNLAAERFLLFQAPNAPMYLNRDEIVRIVS